MQELVGEGNNLYLCFVMVNKLSLFLSLALCVCLCGAIRSTAIIDALRRV